MRARKRDDIDTVFTMEVEDKLPRQTVVTEGLFHFNLIGREISRAHVAASIDSPTPGLLSPTKLADHKSQRHWLLYDPC